MRKISGVLIALLILSSSFIIPLTYLLTDDEAVAQEDSPSSNLKWVLLGDTPREDIKDTSMLTYSNYELTFTYGGYYLTYAPYVIYNGNYWSLEDIINQFPNIMQTIQIDRPPFAWKYSLNITNIPVNLQPNIQYIGFKRIDTNLNWQDIELRTEGLVWNGYANQTIILVKDKIEFRFDDLLINGFTISLNRTDILIGNIQSNIIDNSLYLDPSIELQDANTENLDDARVFEFLPNNNFGGQSTLVLENRSGLTGRSYLKFNLSQIVDLPDFEQITDATLYLNHTVRSGAFDLNTTSHFANNTVWDEGVITWNNQPCGNTAMSFNANCDETWSDSALITQAGGLNIWYNWNVTSIIQNYNITDSYVSIILVAEFTTPDTNDFKAFASKEDVFTAGRPILNVTYSTTPPTWYLTSLFYTGIASIDINGTSTANLTETAINDTELALGVANAESSYSFLYWDNETTTHIHSITITETMTANTTVTAFAIAVGGGGVAGVSMLLIAVVGGFAVIVILVASRKR